MTENQLREERRALLTWFARHEVSDAPAQWQRNIDRLKQTNHELFKLTNNPIYKSRTHDQ